MLKVDEAYLSRSQAFIFVLFSGLQGNGNSEGRGGAAPRCGHEHIALWAALVTGQAWAPGQPSLRARIELMSGDTRDACGCVAEVSLLGGGPVGLPRHGKVRGRSPRLSSES